MTLTISAQDLDEWKSTWGNLLGHQLQPPPPGASPQIRPGRHSQQPVRDYFWSYKPTADWNITLGADNFIPYRFELEQFKFAGPRPQHRAAAHHSGCLHTAPSRGSICSCARLSDRPAGILWRTAKMPPHSSHKTIRGGTMRIWAACAALMLLAGPAFSAEPRKPGRISAYGGFPAAAWYRQGQADRVRCEFHSKIIEGTVRRYWIYVPAKYDAKNPPNAAGVARTASAPSIPRDR